MGRSKDCSSSTLDCSSPRRIVSRWISSLRRYIVKKVRVGKDMPTRIVHASCSMDRLNESGTTGQNSSSVSSLNLGVGCCLLYIFAASKNELNKMTDIRMQMEALLQNTRQALLKKDEVLKPSDEPDCHDFETPDLPESSRVKVCDQSLKWERPEVKEGRDQLEAELEVELELLQLQLERENLLKLPEQLNIKVADKPTSSTKSQTISSGEVIDPQTTKTDTEFGICPNELERRLHELLEARQEEQITELEAAMARLKQTLYEKEMEVSWWKDRARLLSQHAIQPSQFITEHDLKIITPQCEHPIGVEE